MKATNFKNSPKPLRNERPSPTKCFKVSYRSRKTAEAKAESAVDWKGTYTAYRCRKGGGEHYHIGHTVAGQLVTDAGADDPVSDLVAEGLADSEGLTNPPLLDPEYKEED